MNANSSEQARGSLGILNWVGDRLLYLAHLRRPNTIAGGACGLNIRVMSIIEVEALLYLAHLSRPNTIAGGACGLNIRVLSVVEVSLKLSPAVPGPPEAAKHHSR